MRTSQCKLSAKLSSRSSIPMTFMGKEPQKMFSKSELSVSHIFCRQNPLGILLPVCGEWAWFWGVPGRSSVGEGECRQRWGRTGIRSKQAAPGQFPMLAGCWGQIRLRAESVSGRRLVPFLFYFIFSFSKDLLFTTDRWQCCFRGKENLRNRLPL